MAGGEQALYVQGPSPITRGGERWERGDGKKERGCRTKERWELGMYRSSGETDGVCVWWQAKLGADLGLFFAPFSP